MRGGERERVTDMDVDNVDVDKETPPGILLVRKIRGKDWSLKTYRYLVLLITFVAYASYHASRKPTSIVKSVLDPSGGGGVSVNVYPWRMRDLFVKGGVFPGRNMDRSGHPGWAPFNGKDGTSKLGEIDVAFLACYSAGMFVAGHLGDKLDLRLFLTAGMTGSGFFVGLFGMGYFWNIHAFGYFLVMQMLAGFFQSTGWPSVVAVIGNWFGKQRRGLIMGIWNAHTSVGNITGSLLAAGVLDYGWGWSFIVPGAFISLSGLLVFLFLAAYPEDIEFPCANGSEAEVHGVHGDIEVQEPETSNLGKQNDSEYRHKSGLKRGVGLYEACMIPGVIPFALCLFFAKLVAYTFLFWLPFYLTQIGKLSLLSLGVGAFNFI